jgi:hypothetical protein
MKRQRLIAASSVLVVAVLALTATPAAAKKSVTAKYQGDAPGSVTCSISVKVKYSPAMTNSGGRASHVSVKLSGCHASDPRVHIGSAKLQPSSPTAAFTATPLNCQPDNTPPPALDIKWSGTFTGMMGSTSLRGKATYSPSSVTESAETVITSGSGDVGLGLPGTGNTAAVTGSFGDPNGSSASLYTTMTSNAFQTMCAGHGFKMLKLRGTISVG